MDDVLLNSGKVIHLVYGGQGRICFHFAQDGAWLGWEREQWAVCAAGSQRESCPRMAENRNLSDAYLDDIRHSGVVSVDALAAETPRLERNDSSASSIKMVVRRIGDALSR